MLFLPVPGSHSGRWTENNQNIFEWTQSDNIKTTIPKHNFMVFYVLQMAVAIAFLCENAVEAFEISSNSMILSLNCFYSIFAKKFNSHSHFKCIKLYLEVVV